MASDHEQEKADSSVQFDQLKTFIETGDEEKALVLIEDDTVLPDQLRSQPDGRWLGHHCPVCTSAKHGRLKVMKALIRKGFQVENCFDDDVSFCMQPIHLAAYGGNLEMVKLLLDRGVDIESRDNFDNTPLYWAISKARADLDTVKYLVARGANVNTRNNIDHSTVLHTSVSRFGNYEICKYLLHEGADVKAYDKNDYTPLHCAAMNGHVTAARALIDAGADIEARTRRFLTPFLEAEFRNRLEIMKLLFQRGADAEVHDRSNITALHMACLKGEYENAKFLVVEANVNVNARSVGCTTPLELAIRGCSTDLVTLLLKSGCVSVDGVEVEHLFFVQGVSEEDKSDMKDLVRNVLMNPRNLQDLCTFKIRRILGKRIATSVESLPLPSIIKDILKLKFLSSSKIDKKKKA